MAAFFLTSLRAPLLRSLQLLPHWVWTAANRLTFSLGPVWMSWTMPSSAPWPVSVPLDLSALQLPDRPAVLSHALASALVARSQSVHLPTQRAFLTLPRIKLMSLPSLPCCMSVPALCYSSWALAVA